MSNKIQKKLNRFAVFIFIILIAIAAILFFGRDKSSPVPQPKTEKLQYKPRGSFTIISSEGRTILASGEEEALMLVADSAGEVVSGYDAVIIADPKLVQIKEVKNLVDDFDFFKTTRKDGISLTAIKKLDSASKLQFSQTPLAEIIIAPTAQAKEIGRVEIQLQYNPGATDDSNIVSTSTKDVLGVVLGFDARVGSSAVAKLGQTISLTDANLRVQIMEIDIPAQDCMDCQTRVALRIYQDAQTKDMEFISGGLQGAIFEAQEAFGYMFEIETVEQGSVELRYAPAGSQ